MELKERLRFDQGAGAVFDGARRYLLMRPDVPMGALRGLDAALCRQVLAAWREAARLHGGDSLRAYAQSAPDARARLPALTVAAARDLGWGRWRISESQSGWHMTVANSPFAAGAGRCDQAVCAPIEGLFAALVQIVTGDATGTVSETACMAQGASHCEFSVITTGNPR